MLTNKTTDLLVDALAGAWIAYCVVDADVFFEPRVKINTWLAARPDSFPARKVMELLGCTVCVGFWAVGPARFLPAGVRRWFAAAAVNRVVQAVS